LGLPVRSKQTWHRDTLCAPSAHSVSIYYNGAFFKFRTCTYAFRGMRFDRNILCRMDLKFSEDSINNTVARTPKHEPASLYEAAFLTTRQPANWGRGTIGIVRTGVNGCSPALISGAVADSRAVYPEGTDKRCGTDFDFRFPPPFPIRRLAASGRAGDEAGVGLVSGARRREAIPNAAVIFDLDGGRCRAGFRRRSVSRLGDNRRFPYQPRYVPVEVNGVPRLIDSRVWPDHHLNPRNRK
jgi:hypothetical protein